MVLSPWKPHRALLSAKGRLMLGYLQQIVGHGFQYMLFPYVLLSSPICESQGFFMEVFVEIYMEPFMEISKDSSGYLNPFSILQSIKQGV